MAAILPLTDNAAVLLDHEGRNPVGTEGVFGPVARELRERGYGPDHVVGA